MWFDIVGNFQLNILAIFCSTLAMFCVGLLWYAPFFQPKNNNVDKKHPVKVVKKLLLEFVLSLVVVIVLSALLQFNGDMIGILKKGELQSAGKLNAAVLWGNMLLTFILWLGFVAMAGLNEVIRDRKKVTTYLSQTSGLLVGMLVASAVWTLMSKAIG